MGSQPAAAEWAIGIDVGGTKIAAGLLDPATGRRIVEKRLPTPEGRDGEAVLAEVASVALELAAAARIEHGRVVGIGLGVPELVDSSGRVTSAHNFDWRSLPVVGRLGTIAPTTIAADVRAAALAEAQWGAGRSYRSFAYVTVGTGISSTLVLDGRPWPGARGAALVASSGPLSVPCPSCGKVEPFVLEEYASGPALVRRAAERGATGWDRTEAVVVAAAAGDPIAGEVVATAAAALGSAVGWLVNVVDPEAVVVGGGLGSAAGPFWDRLVLETRRHIWNPAAQQLPIAQARLGPAAGWIGAALAAADVANPTDALDSQRLAGALVGAGGR